ncbi:carboxyl-terminal PDZ ligand of neuronal nitric oxide synthase protein-like isoform X2 [Tachypleus tridentatus]|uniref:carboxyl-terminal PDZ ligand of neuronal nitric oxide synthase protein-like isoform X2 n=1 Tax=Tachypleus tridentatus TaxID=6853 RepID=UPI003FCFDF40
MPSKKRYNLVNDDSFDSRIPLHSEEAFHHGITFSAKYIGTMDIPRPSSRVEIVSAMRRIRYEFKTKGIRKKKVYIHISVEGVQVILKKEKKSNHYRRNDSRLLLMQHPIYRIFYVSHDSQDMKIFSYIAREGGSNNFKCSVFKSKKKAQAMRIVHTVGQAFEVCHKLSLPLPSSSGGSQEEVQEDRNRGCLHVDGISERSSSNIQGGESLPPTKQYPLSSVPNPQVGEMRGNMNTVNTNLPQQLPISVYHHVQLLQEQLDQQFQQAQAALAEVQFLKGQLTTETAARLEAQSQNHQLMVHNKELLEHIQRLVQHIQELERKSNPVWGELSSPLQLTDNNPSGSLSIGEDFLLKAGQSSSAGSSPACNSKQQQPTYTSAAFLPSGMYKSNNSQDKISDLPTSPAQPSSPSRVTFVSSFSDLPRSPSSTVVSFSTTKIPDRINSANTTITLPSTRKKEKVSPDLGGRLTNEGYFSDSSIWNSPLQTNSGPSFLPGNKNKLSYSEETFLTQVTDDLLELNLGSASVVRRTQTGVSSSTTSPVTFSHGLHKS